MKIKVGDIVWTYLCNRYLVNIGKEEPQKPHQVKIIAYIAYNEHTGFTTASSIKKDGTTYLDNGNWDGYIFQDNSSYFFSTKEEAEKYYLEQVREKIIELEDNLRYWKSKIV